MIPIYSPRIFTESAIDALKSGWISSQGPYIQKATEELGKRMQVPYTILMNNGTSATHMLFRALRYKYPTIDTIYVPNNVFVAVWNTALYEYPKSALHVLEMNPDTLNMRTDEVYIRSLRSNSAVVVVHNVGNIVNVPLLKRIRPDLVFIEDACEGLLGTYEGIPAGSSQSSLCSAVSFFANKTITSGEGGAFFTHDKDVYDYVYRSIHHGLSDERYVYHTPGYNYRMTNLQAALLYDQLLHLDVIVSDKRSLFEEYKRMLGDSVVYPVSEDDTDPAPWMFVCGVRGITYPELDRRLRSDGIDVRPFFYDIHTHRHLSDIPASTMTPFATFCMLPSHPDLSKEDAARVATAIRSLPR